MSTLVEQTELFTNQVEARMPSLTSEQRRVLGEHIDRIRQALNNDAVVGGAPSWTAMSGVGLFLQNDAEDCQEWQRAQAVGSTYANTQFWAWCRDWEFGVRQQLVAAADYLESIGEAALAEVADSLADRSQTSGEQADIVVPDKPSDWWTNTPTWVKWAVPIGIAVYAFGVLQVGKAAVRR